MSQLTKKDVALGLANAIKEGIAKHQAIIKSNSDKEGAGFAKLSKGQVNPAQSGVGTDIPAGAPMVDVPNMKAERHPNEAVKAHDDKLQRQATVNTPGYHKPGTDNWYPKGHSKYVAPKTKENLRAEHEASKVEKGELDAAGIACPGCGGTSITVLGSLGGNDHLLCGGCGALGTSPRQENTEAMAEEDPSVMKGEVKGASKVEKGEIKEAPMIGTVTAKKVDGAKDGTEKIPAAEQGEGTGGKTIGKAEREGTKKLGKGAMVDHIKAKAAQAGVDPAKVLKVPSIPKTLPKVKPAPMPQFVKTALGNKNQEQHLKSKAQEAFASGKAAYDKNPNQETLEREVGKAAEAQNKYRGAIKNNKRAEHEASKVEKGEKKPTPGKKGIPDWSKLSKPATQKEKDNLPEKVSNKGTWLDPNPELDKAEVKGKDRSYDENLRTNFPSVYAERATGNKKAFDTTEAKRFVEGERQDKKAQHEASKVEKAESPAAKPIAKSPASGAPAKAPAVAPKAPAPKVSKL